MIVVRVVQTGDVDALVSLAQETGPGLTTFKPDRDALAARIERSRRTLAGQAAPAEAGYFFVMEDSQTGDIAGVCGIESQVGLEQPFYNYRVSPRCRPSSTLPSRRSSRLRPARPGLRACDASVRCARRARRGRA